MIQKIISADDLDDLNKKIVEWNKKGWSAKQLFVGERPSGSSVIHTEETFYVLLEKASEWK